MLCQQLDGGRRLHVVKNQHSVLRVLKINDGTVGKGCLATHVQVEIFIDYGVSGNLSHRSDAVLCLCNKGDKKECKRTRKHMF